MSELGTSARLIQEHQFFEWFSNPENQQAVGREWQAEWERDHWVNDEPEQPLHPEEQAKVDDYYSRIINTLEARTGEFADTVVDEASRQRAISNWGGGAFLRLYDGTSGDDRTAIIRAMGKAIEKAEQHPTTSAQVLEIVTDMGLTQVEGSVKRLAKTPIALQNGLLHDAITNYKGSRILATLDYERSKEIYQRLTSTPS